MGWEYFQGITRRWDKLVSQIITEVFITSDVRDTNIVIDETKEWNALWDTGASCTSISKKVIKELGLKPTGKHKTSTASEEILANEYNINLAIPKCVKATDLSVIENNVEDKFDCIIGMDIIGTGDFSITNKDEHTTFSFRVPSIKEIDYEKEMYELAKQLVAEAESS